MLSKIKYRFLNFWTISTLVLLVFFAIALIYPLSNLIINSFQTKDGSFSLQNYIEFFSKPYYLRPLRNSLEIGIISTLISTAVGVALAYVMHRYNIALKGILKILFVVGLMAPPFIGAYSWILLLGRNGILRKFFGLIGITLPPIYGKNGIVLVFSLSLSCYVFRYVTAALMGIDSTLE